MKQHKQTTDNGFIVYRHPNVIERMKLLGDLGLSTREDIMQAYQETSEFTLLAKVMEAIHNLGLTTKIELKVDGKTVTTWKEAIECNEFLELLTKAAADILEGLSPKEESGGTEGNEKTE